MLLIQNNDLNKKNQKSSYQIRQIFFFLLQLDLFNFRLKPWKGLRVIKNVKQTKFQRVWVELELRKTFPERISRKIFDTNSSFYVK